MLDYLHKRLHLFVLLWLAVSLMVGIQWAMSEYQRIQEDFDRTARLAHGVIARKLDQNESVLAALDAMLMSRQKFEMPILKSFSHQLLSHYSQLYTVEFFQNVSRDNRSTFLDEMQQRFGKTFFIRDFDIAGRRSWIPAPVREQHLVVTMIEPDIAAASSVYGYDVLHEPRFATEIKQAIRTGRKVASVPFDLYEGGRVYLLMQPVFLDSPVRQASGARKELIGVVALVVYCEKLLTISPGEGVPADLELSIMATANPGSTIYTIPGKHSNGGGWWPAVAKLDISLPLVSQSQPFTLRVGKEVFPGDFKFGGLLLREGLVLSLMLSLWLLYSQRLALRRAQSQADEALFLQSERAAVALNAVHDGVIILDTQQQIEMANPMALTLLGVSREEVVGQPYQNVFRLIGELSAEFAENPISECYRQAHTVELPERMQLATARGHVRLVEGAIAPLFSRAGSLTGVVCALRDMGPVRQRAAEALEASELRVKEHLEKLSHVARLHTMGEMASGIAHEVNQPLTAISNYCQASLQLLEFGEDSRPQIESALRLAVAQADRAGEIIKRLRALVSKRAMEIRLIDLNQVVGNCMFLAEYDLKERGIEMVQLLSVYPMTVMADSIQMEQVVLNLLSNAMDALRDEPVMKRHIIIHTRREGKKAILEVRDTGRGISPESLEVLFHPFFSTKQNGMGLGLSICQTIVEQYGGLICAENIPASGACFRIELPLSQTVAATEQEPAAG
ncbi:ATP-binding protein [Aquitalea pelogenes]|uniref:ATP-binding protein n=1 Tax=Aquitalea pelogenes TaxID=1293573 RepID=UPI000A823722|nr:ATP-binding protein [Aquitalea pelogenes]